MDKKSCCYFINDILDEFKKHKFISAFLFVLYIATIFVVVSISTMMYDIQTSKQKILDNELKIKQMNVKDV